MTPLIRTLVVTNVMLILSIVLIGAWLYSNLPEQHPGTASNGTDNVAARLANAPRAEPERAGSEPPGGLLSAREVETIVRETVRSELRRLSDPRRLSATEFRPVQQPADPDPGILNDPQRIEEHRIQHRIVAEEIDHFIEQGRISSTEMAALQVEIGKLSPDGRIAAMQRLVAALNSGELEGQL